jgi:hypothetical protein
MPCCFLQKLAHTAVLLALQVTSPIELNLLTEEEYYQHLKQVRLPQYQTPAQQH